MGNKDFMGNFNPDKLGDMSRLPKEELQKRMEDALSGAGGEGIGKMMEGLDVQKIKEKLSGVDPQALGKIVENIKGMDSKMLERIKKMLSGRSE